MKVCELKGCGKLYHASGLCRPHYMAKWWKNGHPRRTNPWTKEAKALVAGMLLEKLSASQIVSRLAPDIRVSRNAVIGVVHRDATLRSIGLHGGSGAIPKNQPRPRRPQVRKTGIKALFVPAPGAPAIIVTIPARPRSIPLMDLKRGECKFAVNQSATRDGHLFCGNPSEPDKPYCAGHLVLSYKRPLDRPQSTGDRK